MQPILKSCSGITAQWKVAIFLQGKLKHVTFKTFAFFPSPKSKDSVSREEGRMVIVGQLSVPVTYA